MSYENESARIWDELNDTREDDYYKNKAWDAYDELCEYYGSEMKMLREHTSKDSAYDHIRSDEHFTKDEIEMIKDEIYADLLKQAVEFDDYE